MNCADPCGRWVARSPVAYTLLTYLTAENAPCTSAAPWL